MNKEHFYDVDLKWNQDRKGTLSSPALKNTVDVATPPEFPGGMAGIWSPEHLFVSAVSSCLMTTFLAITENSKLEFTDFQVSASGKLEKVDGKFRISEITLDAEVDITDGAQREKAERILHKAESACLISNSITSRIIFNTTVNISEMV